MMNQASVAKDARGIQLRTWALIVLALTALLFFLSLGDRSLWGPEGRWAEITREMQLSGNYFWPTINGQVYYDKPLPSYWLVAVSSYLTGGLNEASARLPSAMAGLIGVALLMLLARRLYDLRTGILAAVVLTTSYSYVFFSRLASADMENVAGVVGALALFVHHEDRQDGWWVVGLWLIMAVTSLTKGLLGFALPLLVLGCYSLLAQGIHPLWERLFQGPGGQRLQWAVARLRWLLNWKTLVALVLALFVYLLPFAISHEQMGSNTGLYMVFRENVLRFFDPFDHRGPFYIYSYWIFVLMAPWSVFLPGALVQAHSNCRAKGDRFVLVYFWATFIFFTLSGSRRGYYLLPILPAAAVLVARLFSTPREALARRAQTLMHLGFFCLAVIVLIVEITALLPSTLRPGPLRGIPKSLTATVFAPYLLLMVAGIVYALVDFCQSRIAFSSSVVAYSSLLFLFVVVLPKVESYRGEKPFAEAVREELNDDMNRLLLYKIWGPGLIFYLAAPQPVGVYSGEASLAQVIQDNPDRWIIAIASEAQTLPVGSSVALVSHYFNWNKSPYVFDEYLLLRPSQLAEPKKEAGGKLSDDEIAR